MDGYPLRRMVPASSPEGRVDYLLQVGPERWPVSELIGKRIALQATGALTCTCCGRRVRKFYGAGVCYPCLRDAPEASPCIIHPELCRAHLGEGRDIQWEWEHHFQEHVVYLAQTGATTSARGGIKVGVTRSSRMPARWIDQGAVAALPIARMPYRQLAGAMEVVLKAVLPDRTDRNAMLRNVTVDGEALLRTRSLALGAIPAELLTYGLPDAPLRTFTYPGHLPPRVVGVSLSKTPEFIGTLCAVKGQYLVLGDGRALNIMAHSGFHVWLDILTAGT